MIALLGFCYRLFSGLVASNAAKDVKLVATLDAMMGILHEMRKELRWLHDQHTGCALSTPEQQRSFIDGINKE